MIRQANSVSNDVPMTEHHLSASNTSHNAKFQTSTSQNVNHLDASQGHGHDPLTDHWHNENFSGYVAELQLHMTLQARKLLPSIGRVEDSVEDSRDRLLRESQADLEKLASRQSR